MTAALHVIALILLEIVRVLHAALRKQGAPEDLVLCLEKPEHPARTGARVDLRRDDRDRRLRLGPPRLNARPREKSGGRLLIVD